MCSFYTTSACASACLHFCCDCVDTLLQVLSEQIRDLDASRKELEIACEPLKKKAKKTK